MQLEKNINNLINLSIEVEEVKTLLEINYNHFFNKNIDPCDVRSLNSMELIQNYEKYSLINAIALDKLNEILGEFQRIENEYKGVPNECEKECY